MVPHCMFLRRKCCTKALISDCCYCWTLFSCCSEILQILTELSQYKDISKHAWLCLRENEGLTVQTNMRCRKMNQGHMASRHMHRVSEINVPTSLLQPLISTTLMRAKTEIADRGKWRVKDRVSYLKLVL